MGIKPWMLRCVLLLATQSALAQGAAEVVSNLTVGRVGAAADGKETVAPAAGAKPGDVLEYVATYRSKSAVRQLEATLPIPVGTEYLPGSATPVGARASTDGAAFAPIPLKRKVKQADGKEVEQLVPSADYRALRWPPQDLAAGAVAKVSARVRLIADAPPPAGSGK